VAVGTVSLMPADNVEGMRADTLALLKDLNSPIYRWPGGNFVSGYDWRDGIGDRDRRPPRTNPAWTGVEHNDFGMHEFIRFCRLLETEPWITVNTGFGDAHSAAAHSSNTATAVTQIRDAIRERAEPHRKLQPTLANLKGRTIPISMDEWNYWHREYAYGELGCIYELQDGLGIAAGLHEFFRHTDLIKVATYAQTVNVIGAIKTSRTAAEMETTGLVLQLYRKHFGTIPIILDGDHSPLDISAALTEDGGKLTIGVVNPGDTEVTLKIDLAGAKATGAATRWHITGKDRFAHNSPGQPRAVDITRTDGIPTTGELQVPALANALFVIPLR
jgi:alpha-L-arabinofuranosidase